MIGRLARQYRLLLGLLGLVGLGGELAGGGRQEIALNLRSRDKGTGEMLQTFHRVDSHRVGVVVMDMWSYHWCLTCAQRASALVPRMNQALRAARDLEMTVIFTPTSAMGAHENSPQRAAARSLPDAPWPELKAVDYPNCGFKNVYTCRCGPGIGCQRDWGGNSMNPDLQIGTDDLIAWGSREMWNIIQSRKLEQLIYLGIAADICVLGKGEGMVPMAKLGMPSVLARDLTDTDSYPPKEALEHTLKVLETDFAPTIHFSETLRALGYPQDDLLEMVQIRPWGKPDRPYFFEGSLEVHLEGTEIPGSEIRFTENGLVPTANAALYRGPISLKETTWLRVQRFHKGQTVGLPSDAYFVRRPQDPPRPTLRLWELEPLSVEYSDETDEWHVPARTWGVTMRGENYSQGITLHAPGSIEFVIPPGATQFVALGGADDAPKGRFNAQFLGQYPSVILEVWVDDLKVAESPMMRMGQKPWPFEVELDQGAGKLKLVVSDGGNGSRLDFGNFVRAGFVIPNYRGPRNLY